MVRHATTRPGIVAAVTLVAGLAVGSLALGAGGAGHTSSAARSPGTVVEPTPLVAGDGGALFPWSVSAMPWVSPVAGTIDWRVPFAWHVPVLMYHLIATPAQAVHALPGLVVSPILFSDQLRAAWQAGWRTITASQLARDMAIGAEPPPRSFVITIDDGSVDGWTAAYPILRAFHFVATFFVPTARIGRPGDLSAAQVIALSEAGMEIANHTVDHVPLAHVAPVEAQFQIGDAQSAIAALLGAPPVSLAYPFGNRDFRVIEDVAAAGIGIAFTTVGGCSETLAARLDEPRLRVSPTTTPAHLVGELDRCGAMPAWG